jgi:hypothetical protein
LEIYIIKVASTNFDGRFSGKFWQIVGHITTQLLAQGSADVSHGAALTGTMNVGASVAGVVTIGLKLTSIYMSIQDLFGKHHASIEAQAQSTTAGAGAKPEQTTNPNSQRLVFQSQDPRIDSRDGDLNKDDLINFDVPFREGVVQTWHDDLVSGFRTGYKLSAEGDEANREAQSLLDHFINGEQTPDKLGTDMGSEMFFDQNSEIARILGSDPKFLELKKEFENWANYHYKNNSLDFNARNT